VVTKVDELDLPAFDYSDPQFVGEAYHERLRALREQHWLARTPIAILVLDRSAGEFFLRSRATAFPGREIAGLFDITSGPLFDHIDANILNLSDDLHRRLRGIVSRAFTPAAAVRWRPVMREILEDLWAGIDGRGRMEVVSELAKPYPSRTIAAIFGAPAQDAARLHEWSTWVQKQFDLRALSTELAQVEAAVVEVNAYVEQLLSGSSEHAEGSLLGALLAAEADGDRLSHEECVNLAVNVLAGAIDTTQSQLSHALHLFAAHPDQWQRLGASPELAPAAVTEVLRIEPVAPFTARVCREDVEYDGVQFPAGTIVAISAERANRQLEGGEDFDITAERDGRLLTFGAGQHLCLGANLARAELEEALAFLAPRTSELALDGEPGLGGVEGIYGVEQLALRWTPRTP
jgi:cytochrome P450